MNFPFDCSDFFLSLASTGAASWWPFRAEFSISFSRNLSHILSKLIHPCFILVCQSFFVFRLDCIGTSSVDFFFFQSKRDVDRRLEELRDHYERGNAETERKLRRELKKTKALLRDAQAVIETQVSCRPHPIPLSHLSWCLL